MDYKSTLTGKADDIDTDFNLFDAGRHFARQADALRKMLEAELGFCGGGGALQLVAITDMLQIRQQMLKSTPNRSRIDNISRREFPVQRSPCVPDSKLTL